MRHVTLATAIVAILVIASAAIGATWMTTPTGSTACTGLRPGGVCWLTDIDEDSSAVAMRQCHTFVVQVYGTGASIMPQSCGTAACSQAENLLSAALTGDSPNSFVTSEVTFDFIRIDWTTDGAGDNNDVAIKCGR